MTAQRNGFLFSLQEFRDDLDLNLYDFGARLYDPLLGRFTTIDPLADQYVGLTPYNYVSNSPLIAVDPDGRRIFISGSEEYRKQILGILSNLAAGSKTGRKIIYDAIKSDHVVLIAQNTGLSNGLSDKTKDQDGNKKALLTFNVGEASQDLEPSEGQGDKGIESTPEVSMSHELQHFNDFADGKVFGYVQDPNNRHNKDGSSRYFSESEVSAVDAENKVRAEMGLPLRTHYGGVNVFNKELPNKNSYTLINKRNPTDYSTFFKSNTTLSRSSENMFTSQLQAWWKHSFRIRTGKNTKYGFPPNRVKITTETGSTQITGY